MCLTQSQRLANIAGASMLTKQTSAKITCESATFTHQFHPSWNTTVRQVILTVPARSRQLQREHVFTQFGLLASEQFALVQPETLSAQHSLPTPHEPLQLNRICKAVFEPLHNPNDAYLTQFA
ncbi:unnamed protein product [Gongylonema pulchrum]|uniref:Uncharacterized protein n=1 Tax=Gongylonema pulchrum TaxID=637853 RepID=A0A183E6J5_9BILA|nr:unnamed protein product [Gongylonema pulchrum]